jgi:16S rRNA (cytosine967-C5)-methyltransferase
VVRDHAWLSALAARLSDHPQRSGTLLQSLLLVGLQQLRRMRVPVHAAVHATVEACSLIQQEGARGFMNAVLRRYARDAQTIEAEVPRQPELRWSHPEWLVAEIRRDWPLSWREVLEGNQRPGPLTLRINQQRTTASQYLERLAALGIGAQAVAGVDSAVCLDEAIAVERIPGFAEGEVSVQDASAQIAAGLLQAQAGMRVLDACSAPGGKTGHLLEQTPQLELTALDIDAARLQRVAQNLQRLDLRAHLVAGNLMDTGSWWDGRAYDRILLDAPCSGSGVIRRHPDIKWLRRPTDLQSLPRQQQRLLAQAWTLLAPQGLLLFATCSILRAEGAGLLRAFLNQNRQAQALSIEAAWGDAEAIGRRIPPGGAFDGFYYALIRKS